MFNNTSFSRLWDRYGMHVLMLFAVLVLFLMPHVAHAVSETGSKDLPFEEPLTKLTDSIKGPVAFSISLIGIVAAGAVLIFGGEMSGFLRTMVFLVLVIAIIVNASNIITMVGGDGALIAHSAMPLVKSSLSAVRGIG
jgi:type IV secretion system protein TrbC